MWNKARTAGRLAMAASVALGLGIGATPPAQAGSGSLGHRSLGTVLAADGSGFDHHWRDFDIVDNAVRAVLEADPGSDVAVLTKGRTPLTAFIPTDRAFKRLANDVLGKQPRTEKKVFGDLAGALGVGTIETVLLYHVVPGATITYKQARQADGAALDTAAGDSLTVNVKRVHGAKYVALRDADKTDRNPLVVHPNINKGNKQVAHGINRVLRPVDL